MSCQGMAMVVEGQPSVDRLLCLHARMLHEKWYLQLHLLTSLKNAARWPSLTAPL